MLRGFPQQPLQKLKIIVWIRAKVIFGSHLAHHFNKFLRYAYGVIGLNKRARCIHYAPGILQLRELIYLKVNGTIFCSSQEKEVCHSYKFNLQSKTNDISLVFNFYD